VARAGCARGDRERGERVERILHLGEVRFRNGVRPLEVGHGSRHFEPAIEPSPGERHRLDGTLEQPLRRPIQTGLSPGDRTGQMRVAGDADPGKALSLSLATKRSPSLGRSFSDCADAGLPIAAATTSRPRADETVRKSRLVEPEPEPKPERTRPLACLTSHIPISS
jgi:hypothetical protein